MFDNLTEQINGAIHALKGKHRISDINIATTTKEIRRALVRADVGYKIAKRVTEDIKQKALGAKVLTSISPGQLFTKITKDELARLMGNEASGLRISATPSVPSVVLMAGLQGSGKTTFCAKLALKLKKKGYRVLLAACDVHRPAAIDQLQKLAQSINIEVYAKKDTKDALLIAKEALVHAKTNGFRVLIVDTAGRQAVNKELMQELIHIQNALKPEETLFVADAMTGQDAIHSAQAFNEAVNYTGVVLTKLDGDSRGGAALSIHHTTNKPIKFISTGEKLADIDNFHPERMAQRILGMGDVVSLVEKAQSQFDKTESQKLLKKIHKNAFDINDFLAQLKKVQNIGGVKEIANMMPGIGKVPKNIDSANIINKTEAIIQSMTPKERQYPSLIKNSHKQRIAKGCGHAIHEVNDLLKRYDMMCKMIKAAKKNPMAMMQNLKSISRKQLK